MRSIVRLLLLIFCWIPFYKANAQYSIGLTSGLTVNHLDYSYYNSNIRVTAGKGFSFNLLLEKELSKFLSIEISPGLIQKNYNLINQAGIQQTITNNYLDFPLLLSFTPSLFNHFSGSFALGGYCAYWLNSSVKGQVPNIFESRPSNDGSEIIQLDNIKYRYQFNKDYDNRIDFGVAGKLAIDYHLNHSIGLLAGYHLFYSLSSIQKQTTIFPFSELNKTQLFDFGVVYKINR